MEDDGTGSTSLFELREISPKPKGEGGLQSIAENILRSSTSSATNFGGLRGSLVALAKEDIYYRFHWFVQVE